MFVPKAPPLPPTTNPCRHLCILKEEVVGQINHLWSTWVTSIILVALSPASTIYPSTLPRKPLYLTVGSSFEETGPGEFAGSPGNEGDVNRSAVDQKLCGWWLKEEWWKDTDSITQSAACEQTCMIDSYKNCKPKWNYHLVVVVVCCSSSLKPSTFLCQIWGNFLKGFLRYRIY